jgi:hypothetical protein
VAWWTHNNDVMFAWDSKARQTSGGDFRKYIGEKTCGGIIHLLERVAYSLPCFWSLFSWALFVSQQRKTRSSPRPRQDWTLLGGWMLWGCRGVCSPAQDLKRSLLCRALAGYIVDGVKWGSGKAEKVLIPGLEQFKKEHEALAAASEKLGANDWAKVNAGEAETLGRWGKGLKVSAACIFGWS